MSLDLDERTVVSLQPVELPRKMTVSTWPCAACMTWYDITDGFVAQYYDNGRLRSAYLCPGCARSL